MIMGGPINEAFISAKRRASSKIDLNQDRALPSESTQIMWIPKTLLVVVALWAVGIHAAPQPLLELVGERVFHSDLKEEDRKFVTDPSANTDGNLSA